MNNEQKNMIIEHLQEQNRVLMEMQEILADMKNAPKRTRADIISDLIAILITAVAVSALAAGLATLYLFILLR